MPTLSAGQLASMKQAVDGSLTTETLPNGQPSIMQVLENQSVKDGIRGKTDNWVTVRSYPCTVTTMTPLMESVRGGKVQAEERYKFSLPDDAIVDPANRLRWNGAGFEVKAVDIATSSAVETIVYAVRLG